MALKATSRSTCSVMNSFEVAAANGDAADVHRELTARFGIENGVLPHPEQQRLESVEVLEDAFGGAWMCTVALIGSAVIAGLDRRLQALQLAGHSSARNASTDCRSAHHHPRYESASLAAPYAADVIDRGSHPINVEYSRAMFELSGWEVAGLGLLLLLAVMAALYGVIRLAVRHGVSDAGRRHDLQPPDRRADL